MNSTNPLLKDNNFHRVLFWICKEWKVLPTDPRFLNLTLEQIDWLLFWNEQSNQPPTVDISPEAMSFMDSIDKEVDDNQVDRRKTPKVETEKYISRVEDALRVFEQGGDVSDWEDVTKQFLPAEQ